jgi:hypothetical protein
MVYTGMASTNQPGIDMDLRTYFRITKRAEREAFSKAVGAKHNYLYNCSLGKRKPGSDLCKRIVARDPRFTLGELRPDIWGDGVDSAAASDDTQPPVGGVNKSSKMQPLVV